MSELNGELDEPIDSGQRVVISGLRTIIWDEHNLPSNQIANYGASTQATAEVVVIEGDDEAEAIGRAVQVRAVTVQRLAARTPHRGAHPRPSVRPRARHGCRLCSLSL